MVLVNGGFLHCTDIKKNSCKFFSENDKKKKEKKKKKKKKKMARAISKNQVSDPGPSWPSCLNLFPIYLLCFWQETWL